jgi:acyl carrier protein
MQLAISIEEHFDIAVPESSLPEVKTVRDMTERVVDLLRAQACPDV